MFLKKPIVIGVIIILLMFGIRVITAFKDIELPADNDLKVNFFKFCTDIYSTTYYDEIVFAKREKDEIIYGEPDENGLIPVFGNIFLYKYQGDGYYINDDHNMTDAHAFEFYSENDQLMYEIVIGQYGIDWRISGNHLYYLAIFIVTIVAVVMEIRQRKKIKEGDE